MDTHVRIGPYPSTISIVLTVYRMLSLKDGLPHLYIAVKTTLFIV